MIVDQNGHEGGVGEKGEYNGSCRVFVDHGSQINVVQDLPFA